MLCLCGVFRGTGQIRPREGKTLTLSHLARGGLSWGLNPSLWAPKSVFSLLLCVPGLTGCPCVYILSPPCPLPVVGQAWLSNPVSCTSWLADLGEEGCGGFGWEEFRPSSSLGLMWGGAFWADTEPLCLGHCAKQLVWDFWAFFTLKNNCIVWGACENLNPSPDLPSSLKRFPWTSPPSFPPLYLLLLED